MVDVVFFDYWLRGTRHFKFILESLNANGKTSLLLHTSSWREGDKDEPKEVVRRIAPVPAMDLSKERPEGSRDRLLKLGPEAFTQEILKEKKILRLRGAMKLRTPFLGGVDLVALLWLKDKRVSTRECREKQMQKFK